MTVEIVLNAQARIGEAPTWSPDEAALYWIDIKAQTLHRACPATGDRRHWTLDSEIGAFALLADGDGAVVALRQGLFRLDFASGAQHLLAPPPFDPALHRFTEGACDPAGRFWGGVMFDPIDPGQPPCKAGLHSITLAGGLRAEPDAADLHNGMAWSPDGRYFYLSHSNERRIRRFPVGPQGLGPPDLFATIPEGLGIPDGAAVDVEGGYWCALHGGSRLHRYRSDGTLD